MRIEINIALKPSVLDPQGQAVEDALSREGIDGASNCRIGKIISLDVPDMPPDQLEDYVAKMSEAVLVNPIIEHYTFKIMDEA